MHGHVLYNDTIYPASEKILSPGQIGLLSGWGIFTTLRIYDGIPFALERHWRRLERDAALLHIELRQGYEQVRRNLQRLVEVNGAQEATMRLCIVRSQGGFWEGPGSGNASDLIVLSNDLKAWSESVALTVAEQGRHAASPFARSKTLSWAQNMAMMEAANQQGFSDVILLNERGEVAECTSANIFAVKDGNTYTPPLASGPLPGVTRAVMLEEIAAPRVAEKVLRLDDLYQADEVFITSTTRELLPVHRILDRPIPSRGHGAWTVMHALQAALTAYIRRYVEEAKRAAVSGD